MARFWSLRKALGKHGTESPKRVDTPTSTAGTIEVGDFLINTLERSATVLGEKLKLTFEEFDVLVFLTTHPQRCVTSRTVLATNWTDDDRHQTEFLKVLLSLRKKLENLAEGKQYLRTEPWVIYRFDPRSSFAHNPS
jgi:DNA-binding response OmpR family regulator